MKKIILFFTLILSFGILSAQENNLELGIRYLKLGNTYLKTENYELSFKYINRGLNTVKGISKYWEAVAYEYLGYYFYEAEENKTKAIENLNKAQLIYKELLGQKDGSQVALESVLDMIQYLNNKDIENEFEYKSEIDILPEKGPSQSQNNNSKNTKILNFENQKLRDLPTDIPVNVENMSLADNKFREFPIGLLNFKNLEYLNLENNKIKSIPDDVSNLKKLKYLNLSNNNLKGIPAGLALLQNLKVLELKGNKIPFEDIANLIRVMPNTNILFDEYILKPEKGTSENEAPIEENEF